SVLRISTLGIATDDLLDVLREQGLCACRVTESGQPMLDRPVVVPHSREVDRGAKRPTTGLREERVGGGELRPIVEVLRIQGCRPRLLEPLAARAVTEGVLPCERSAKGTR